MNITVLQGLNLVSDTTTVVIELEKAQPELLERFKNLHPIFMKSYYLKDGKTVRVETNIPHLWKNPSFIQPIEDHALGKMTYEEAEGAMMEIATIFLGSMTTIPTLYSAHALGYETVQLYVNEGTFPKKGLNVCYCIGIGAEQQFVYSASSSRDSSRANKTQRDKYLTNQFIEEMGIPLAPWAVVDSKEELPAVAEKLGFPLVVKPAGLTGGHGVHVGIASLEELQSTWDRIQYYFENEMNYKESKAAWQKRIIVQQVIKGNDYRLLIVDGTLEIATHRKQARVIGDGSNSVEKLIEIENRNPARDTHLPTHTLKPIVIDEDLKKVLSKQNLSLDYVPKQGEEVRVRDVASMSQGGITEDVTEKICPQIRYVAESIARSIHAHVLGLDVLCQDITKPLTLDNGGIIEMNTMPEMYLNTFPVIGKQYPEVNEKMVKSLMKEAGHTNTIVVIGDIPEETIKSKIQEAITSPGRIGTLHNGTYSIDGQPVNTGLSTHEGVLCLKKNASLDTIVLHYDSSEDIERNGFGFNSIDVLIAPTTALQPIEKRVSELVASKHIHNFIQL